MEKRLTLRDSYAIILLPARGRKESKMTKEMNNANQDILDAVKDLMLPSELDELIEYRQAATPDGRLALFIKVGRKCRIKKATIFIDVEGNEIDYDDAAIKDEVIEQTVMLDFEANASSLEGVLHSLDRDFSKTLDGAFENSSSFISDVLSNNLEANEDLLQQVLDKSILQKVLGNSSTTIPEDIDDLKDRYSKLAQAFKKKAVDTAAAAVAAATNYDAEDIKKSAIHKEWIKPFENLDTDDQIDFFACCIEADKHKKDNSMTSTTMCKKMENFKAKKYSQKYIKNAIANIINNNQHQQANPNAGKLLPAKLFNNYLNHKDYGITMKNAYKNYNKNSYSNGIFTNINIGTKGSVNPKNSYTKAGNVKSKKSGIGI